MEITQAENLDRVTGGRAERDSHLLCFLHHRDPRRRRNLNQGPPEEEGAALGELVDEHLSLHQDKDEVMRPLPPLPHVRNQITQPGCTCNSLTPD